MLLDHFQSVDPVIASLIEKTNVLQPLPHHPPETYFGRLCDDIISQQLSVKAAATIVKRFLDACGVEQSSDLLPEHVLGKEVPQLRSLGLSHAKARYVLGLASDMSAGKLDLANFPHLGDEAVIDQLTQVKGIGRWTAEMFLIFTMGREDVFSWGDLGLRRGLQNVYGMEFTQTSPRARALVESWSPYRSFASRALWRAQDEKMI